MASSPRITSAPTVIDVPADGTSTQMLLPAIATALNGGPAIMPVPSWEPEPRRKSLVAALRPDLPADNSVALIVPTSGSTGTPKLVELSRDALRSSAAATHQRLGGEGTWLLALPASHIAGLMVLVRSAVANTVPQAVDLSAGFHPDAFATGADALFAADPRRAYTALVPRQLSTILQAGGSALSALTQFDAVLLGGSAVRPELLAEASDAGVSAVATYGMTETSGGCVYDGRPLENVEVAATAEGVIQIAGPVLASGYRLRPDLTEAAFVDGWFRTADLGVVDSSGTVMITGRSDDVAVSGGVNVPLAAVDVAVESHPDVREAVAVAVPDAEWGERIVAVVVAADPQCPPDRESVRAHVKSRAPAAHAPQEVVVTDTIPSTPGGKADRQAAAELL